MTQQREKDYYEHQLNMNACEQHFLIDYLFFHKKKYRKERFLKTSRFLIDVFEKKKKKEKKPSPNI